MKKKIALIFLLFFNLTSLFPIIIKFITRDNQEFALERASLFFSPTLKTLVFDIIFQECMYDYFIFDQVEGPVFSSVYRYLDMRSLRARLKNDNFEEKSIEKVNTEFHTYLQTMFSQNRPRFHAQLINFSDFLLLTNYTEWMLYYAINEHKDSSKQDETYRKALFESLNINMKEKVPVIKYKQKHVRKFPGGAAASGLASLFHDGYSSQNFLFSKVQKLTNEVTVAYVDPPDSFE